MKLRKFLVVHKHAQPEPNPFMPETSWYRGLCKKLRTPRLPPVLNPSSKLLGSAILMSLVISISMGLDYTARPPSTAPTLSVVEQSMPLDVWGILFLFFAGIALVGNVFETWPAAILGHGVLAFIYLAISFGVIWSLVENWQGYGWNTGVIYLVFAAFHALVADGCYGEWAREWKKPPVPIEIVEDSDGQPDF